jgi:enoyl-CoA hydratase/carnithine racemase
MLTKLEDYQRKYSHIRFERRNGILQMSWHSDGGPLLWGATDDGPHHQAGAAFYDVGNDPENRIVIITGTGDRWCTGLDLKMVPDSAAVTPLWWDHLYRAERAMTLNLLDIPVPVIGAVNGPCTYHAEILLLSDMVIATPDSVFADDSHVVVGVVPGDGIQIMWQMLLGPNRSRWFQYTNQHIDAHEAVRLGFVGEIVERDRLLPRAWSLAEDLVKRCSPITLRYSRLTQVDYIRRRLHNEQTGSMALEGIAQIMRPQLEEYMSKAPPGTASGFVPMDIGKLP